MEQRNKPNYAWNNTLLWLRACGRIRKQDCNFYSERFKIKCWTLW